MVDGRRRCWWFGRGKSRSAEERHDRTATPAGLLPAPARRRSSSPPKSSVAVSAPPEQSKASAICVEETTLQNQPSAPQSGIPGGILNPSNLWDRAIQKLSDREQEIISQYRSPQSQSNESVVQQLDQLCRIATDKKIKSEQSQWKVTFGGKEFVLRNVADSIIGYVQKLKAVGDLAATCDPVHVALPWAAVRFLLQTVVVESEQAGYLLIGLEIVCMLVNRCKVYESSYLDGMSRSSDQARANLLNCLVNSYYETLRFIAATLLLYDRRTVARAAHAMLNSDKITDLIDKLRQATQDVDIEARIYHGTCTADHQQRVQMQLDELAKPIAVVQEQVSLLWARSERHENKKILDWISVVPHADHHSYVQEKRAKGTGKWFLSRAEYREWRESTASTTLWLHGIPGAGKTNVVANAIEELKAMPEDERLAYFYCNNAEESRRDPASVLNSLLRQLSISRSGHAIQRVILEAYTKRKDRDAVECSQSGPRMEETQELLSHVINTFSTVTLILDALDECEQESRLKIMRVLDALANGSTRPLKILIASRENTDIQIRLGRTGNIGISAKDNKNDIATFLDEVMDKSDEEWQKIVAGSLRNDIKDTIIRKSHDMFQYASLQIKRLLKSYRVQDIQDRLRKLPEGLPDAYREIYNDTQELDDSKRDVALRALQWLASCYEPPTLDVLAAVVCQDTETDGFTTPDPDVSWKFILDACRNLVVLDGNVYRFCHLSAQEYFLGFWPKADHVHFASKICMLVLIPWEEPILRKPCTHASYRSEAREKDPRSRTKIRDYCRYYWGEHLHFSNGLKVRDSRLIHLLKLYLLSMIRCQEPYEFWNRRKCVKETSELAPDCGTFILCEVICRHNLWLSVSTWWSPDLLSPAARNFALGFAVQDLGSDVQWINKLIDLGADPNSQIASSIPILACLGRPEVVRTLVKAGADIHGQYFNRTPLHWAVADRNEPVVRTLLELGADPNIPESPKDDYPHIWQPPRFALHLIAGSIGQFKFTIEDAERITRLLLDYGADVNAQSDTFDTALRLALRARRVTVMRILLEAGANIDPPTCPGQKTIFEEVQRWGNPAAIELMRQYGAGS
ncbi:hypothetical protein BU16DRAFT_566956 [Lophium mytilinum]|uniref:Uncharacterized protein n=1 Tax=Lophium mytilinum TaxID=390894 RepID=A0A6A6QBL0_9PEZI|nr:hypothetical protein BU16DRAFT_566956 [Lophium mytilinum]